MPDLEVKCSRCGSDLHHECHPDTVQSAAIALFMWRPESGFPRGIKGNGDGSEKEETVPFITESFLYPLLGKEDARTFMALVDHLFYSMGIDPRVYQEKAWELLDKRKRDLEAEMKRREEARKKYHTEMQPVSRAPQLGEVKGLTLCTYRNFYCFDVNVRSCEHGMCEEFWDPKKGRSGDSKKPDLGKVTNTPDGGMRVTCKLCKRIHHATPAQVEGWKNEPRYQVTEARLSRDPGFKSQDWLAADCVAKALGFKR